MKLTFAGLFFFLSCTASEPKLPELTIKNNSNQEITIYYHNHHHTHYIVLSPLVQQIIKLKVPQNITIHFNKLHFQQEVCINHTNEPLLIQHENSFSIMQNGIPLSRKVLFDTHRPSLTAREDS